MPFAATHRRKRGSTWHCPARSTGLRGGSERRACARATDIDSDDGPGISTESTWREGIGLANTRARLEKHYGEMQSLRYTNRKEGGLIVEIRLPLRVQKTDDGNGDRSCLRETANINR